MNYEKNPDIALEVLANDYILLMKTLAAERGVVPTVNLPKIAKARVTLGCPITQCPCDKKDPNRGCISDKCYKEIQDEGYCHCRAYRKL